MFLKEHLGQTQMFTVEGELKQLTYLTRIDPFSGNADRPFFR
jgi:hypothetical protein